jgi:CheY-like chemotaxis protein
VTLATGPLAGVPLLESPPTEALHDTVTTAGTAGRLPGLRVLVVDDGETNRQLLNLLLKQAGAIVETAENGRIGVERTISQPFDVILMDMQMPVLDGYSAAQELRARGVKTPIIALTAHAMAGEDKKCLAAGCDGYLTKPVNRERLVATLHNLHAQSLAAVTPMTGTAPAAKPTTDLPHADRQNLPAGPTADLITSELDLSDPELRAIVEEFQRQLPQHLATLETACESENWILLQTVAHSLKGTAGMTGFLPLSHAMDGLEMSAQARDHSGVAQKLHTVAALVQRIAL